MNIEDMLNPNAAVPVDPHHTHLLVNEVRRLRHESDAESLAFYGFVAALVVKFGPEIELSSADLAAGARASLEIADLPDGSQRVRVVQEVPPEQRKLQLVEHKPTLAQADHSIILPH